MTYIFFILTALIVRTANNEHLDGSDYIALAILAAAEALSIAIRWK